MEPDAPIWPADVPTEPLSAADLDILVHCDPRCGRCPRGVCAVRTANTNTT